MAAHGPKRLRALSERSILDALRRGNPVRISELMGATGLTRPTIAAGLRSLQEKEWIAELAPAEGDTGRPASHYVRAFPKGCVAGVDFGVYAITVILQSFDSRVLAQARLAVQPADTVDARIATVRGAIRETLASAGLKEEDLWHMVVATTSTAASDWTVGQLQGAIQQAVPFVPVTADNGPTVLAKREHRDTGRHLGKDLIFIWAGRRPMVSLVLDGRPHTGSHGVAGDLSRLQPVGSLDGSRPTSLWPPSATHPGGDYDDRATAAFADHDPGAQQELLDSFAAFAPHIATLCAALDPATVVLGGPFSQLGDELVRRMEAAIGERALRLPVVRTRPFHESDVSETAAIEARLIVTDVLLGRVPDPVLPLTRTTYAEAHRGRLAGRVADSESPEQP